MIAKAGVSGLRKNREPGLGQAGCTLLGRADGRHWRWGLVKKPRAGEEDPAEQSRLVTGKIRRPHAYPPRLGDSKPGAPVALRRSAQQSAWLGPGPATGVVCPASPPAAASLLVAPSRTRAPVREESDPERRLLGFRGGGGGVGRRGPARRGNHEAAARGGSSSAERRGSLQVPAASGALEGDYKSKSRVCAGKKKRKEKKRKSLMSNPERTQHALFFEIGRVSGKETEKIILPR